MRQISLGPPLTLAHNDSFIPCANPDNHCRTDGDPKRTDRRSRSSMASAA
jgi:hypothetical protein